MGSRIVAARTLAELALHPDPDRWWHTIGVVQRAEELTATVPPIERDVLLVTAWVHDIGHSPFARVTGLAPLDGATFLEARGWPPRVTSLVAHHRGAEALARAAGLSGQLWRYPVEESPLADALTYADQTTGPTGERVSIADSLAGAPHPREVLAAAQRVEQRLRTLRRS
jgi:hypothetical protein